MLPTTHLRSPLKATGISTLIVGIAIALQSVWFYPRELEKLCRPRVIVRQVAVGDGGRVVWATVTSIAAYGQKGADHCVRLHDLRQSPPHCRELRLNAAPEHIACSSQGSYGFVCTREGELYAINVAANSLQPIHLGLCDGELAHEIACSADGSRVIVAGEGLAAWDRASRQMSWQRTDLQNLGGDFDSSGDRFFCCLRRGGILELDAATGATVRHVGEDDFQALGLAVSPDGAWLACQESEQYRMIDRQNGTTRWLKSCQLPVQPQFREGGRTVLVANVEGGATCAELDSSTGRSVRSFPCELQVVGLAMISTGNAYIWSTTTIEEFDLASGQVVRAFRP